MTRATKVLILLLLVAAGGWYVWKEMSGPAGPGVSEGQGRPTRRGGGRRGPGEGPAAVVVEASRKEDVPVTLDAVGTVQALNTVTVRSQVDGRLIELAFREGQDVKSGEILARIDPAVYQAQYDQAVAKKAQDEASLANARLDLRRYVALAATNSGSRQQADTQRALVAQLEAQVQADQAAIDNAKAVLDYTVIRAPLDGRLGIRLVDQGNIVRAGDTTGLVVITQLKPIALLFNLPQQHLRAVTAAMAAGPVPVEALEADNTTVIERGRLEVIDNQVDQATGTVRLKAVFPNDALPLWPGAFVNVRLTTQILRDVTVVPTAAVQRGPSGPFVYVAEGDKAVLRPVSIARQTEAITVLASGVTPPERIVTAGFVRLTDGASISVTDPPDKRAQPGAPPAGGESRPGRRAQPPGEGREPRRGGPDGTPATPRPEAPTGTGSPRP
ncbi:efflux RND transporter periplasmic adaptor subunit [Enterovirga rhinocerotis]|uniref:Multidrug efflux system membrane fusion protein n=1 Tax=Enterovirga rhinocerotis TaxID=1339210 RepID=A0A4R7BQ56_9HYPH|nr:efflux RND transporter periplasmic adaptor subunit [Enterovirga rhinocerotis]TDR87273.1 multidrug efflux system membrane fusion protein [Enterovirga rhinocerotis]